MKLGEFFIDLIVDSSKGELTVGNLVTKMGELEAATVGAVGVVFELAAKMAQFTDISIRTALGLEQYNTLTGESTQELQKWQRVAEQAHVSGESVEKTLRGLSAGLALMNRGGGNPFQPLVDVLGIDLRGKDPTQILEFIRKSREFQALPARQKTDLLSSVGIDPMLAKVFKMSDDEFNKSANLVEGMSETGQANFLKMATAMAQISLLSKQMITDIAEWDAEPFLQTLEAIVKTLNEIRAWYKEFKKSPEDQVAAFNAVAHPFTDTSKSIWKDLLQFVGENMPIPSSDMTPTERNERSISNFGPREIPQSASTSTPSRPVEAHMQINFNGVHTPDEIKNAAEKAFDQKWFQKLFDNGQVIGGGPI